MKPSEEATVVSLPREAKILGDDCYLAEMSDRLHRLRSLLGEREERATSTSTRSARKKRFSKMM